MTGGCRNAKRSAELFNKLNPYFISVDSLTLFSGTELHRMAQTGEFVPAGEKERLMELQYVIDSVDEREMEEYRRNLKTL